MSPTNSSVEPSYALINFNEGMHKYHLEADDVKQFVESKNFKPTRSKNRNFYLNKTNHNTFVSNQQLKMLI